MFKIVSQRAEGCDVEVLLVLDATTGQNAVSQAELFKEAANITVSSSPSWMVPQRAASSSR